MAKWSKSDVAEQLRCSEKTVGDLVEAGVLTDLIPKNPAKTRHYGAFDSREAKRIKKIYRPKVRLKNQLAVLLKAKTTEAPDWPAFMAEHGGKGKTNGTGTGTNGAHKPREAKVVGEPNKVRYDPVVPVVPPPSQWRGVRTGNEIGLGILQRLERLERLLGVED